MEIGSTDDRIGFLMSPTYKSNHPSCLSFFYRVGDAVEQRQDDKNILVVLLSDFKDALTGTALWWSEVRGLYIYGI